MATPFPVDRSKHEDEVWAWLEPGFREHKHQLYLFALGMLGNREDAEDATQIVLLNAYRTLVRGRTSDLASRVAVRDRPGRAGGCASSWLHRTRPPSFGLLAGVR